MAIHALTMPLSPATPVFPGDPPVRFTRHEAARPWHVTILGFGSHVGTHMDAPRHLLPEGHTIEGYGPERWFGEAVVIPAPGYGEDEAIPAGVLDAVPEGLLRGRFALLATGWDVRRQEANYFLNPWPSENLARAVLAAGATLFGIDAANIDSTRSGADAVHRILLGAATPVVENLTGLTLLPALKPLGACFAPILLDGCDGASVRAIAWDLPG
ncbi:MAG: cyclase family protein [Chloroflexota bacterium]